MMFPAWRIRLSNKSAHAPLVSECYVPEDPTASADHRNADLESGN